MYTVNLVDTWGDGWDGTVLGFKQDGQLVGTFGDGFTSGGTFGPVEIPLCEDFETEIVVVNLGSFLGEKQFTVFDPFGNVVFHWPSGGTFNINTIFHTFNSYCTLYDVYINVTDANNGNAIAGAEVAIEGGETLSTDLHGQAHISLPAGSYTAAVSKPQYVAQSVDFAVVNQTVYVNVKLQDDIQDPFGLEVTTEGLEGGQALFSWNNVTGLSEGFEGDVFPPLGWSALSPDGGTGWQRIAVGTAPLPGWNGGVAESAPDGGSYMAYASWEGGGAIQNDQWLVTPQVKVTSGSQLAFYMRYWPSTYPDQVDIRLSTTSQTDPAAFNIVVAALTFGSSSSNDWILYTYDLSNFVPVGTQVYIAFREHVLDNWDEGAAIMLDNVYYGPAKKHAQPEKLTLDQSHLVMERSERNTDKSGVSKALLGYRVYLNDMTTPVAFTNSTHHMFNNAPPGTHTAGVQAVYHSGVSNIVTIDFTMPGPNVTFVVTENQTHGPVQGANVHFNNEVKQTDAQGHATFIDVAHGLHSFQVLHTSYFPSSGGLMVSFPHMMVPITLKVNNTDVTEISLDDIKVFPVPARTVLNVTSPENMKQLQIVNMLGQVVYTMEEVGLRHEISVAPFREGMYVIRIITDIGIETRTIQVIK
jgi:hypothetical protein